MRETGPKYSNMFSISNQLKKEKAYFKDGEEEWVIP